MWSANAFAYVRNNPLKYVDPDGHQTIKDLNVGGDVIPLGEVGRAWVAGHGEQRPSLDDQFRWAIDGWNGFRERVTRLIVPADSLDTYIRGTTSGFAHASTNELVEPIVQQTPGASVTVGLIGGLSLPSTGLFGRMGSSLKRLHLDQRGGVAPNRGVPTPYGLATQADDVAALAARTMVSNGAPLYRIGTTGRSQCAEGQFWALESPLSPGYAARYGIPPANVAGANFIEAATLRPGTPFVTRAAPGIGANGGGGIEVVVPEGGVVMTFFSAGAP